MIRANFFQAYLDESGTHAGSPLMAVAGYFGTHGQWNTFLDNWKYEHFHARDPRFDKLKPELANAIDASGVEGVEVYLRPQEFIKSASEDMKSNMGNAYAVTSFLCVTGICHLVAAENEDARISFVLEDGQPNVLWVQRMLLAFMAEFPMIASVTVTPKKDFPQLHPADFLSHSRSTTNINWMNRLFSAQRVHERTLERELFEATSQEVARLVSENRRQKAQAKHARRMAKGRT